MITVDDFDYEFKYDPTVTNNFSVEVTFRPEQKAWTQAVHTGVYHHWIDMKNECIAVLIDWMKEHNVRGRQSTFLTAPSYGITIEDMDSYIYMKMALGGNNDTN